MKSDGSHTNAAGNRRTRRYRCLEQYFQCDECLKIVVDDNNEQQLKKKSKTNDNNDNDEPDNQLCIDSPRCKGVLRKQNCTVVSKLVVEPFLATLEVFDNHLHIRPQNQQQSIVQVTSVQIRSVSNDAPTITNGKPFVLFLARTLLKLKIPP
jgi:hypothetical protein